MILSVTCIRLKSPLQIPRLILHSGRVFKQLQQTSCRGVKTYGFWKDHYTMTLWEDEESMKAFYTTGAHKEAMKQAGTLSAAIILLRVESDEFLPWKHVRKMLKEQGRKLTYPAP